MTKDKIKSISKKVNPRVLLKDKSTLDSFFVEFKNLLFNYDTSKWEINRYKNFVWKNNLSFDYCHSLLSEMHKKMYRTKQKGNIGFLNYISSLEKFNNINIDRRILIDKANLSSFIGDLETLRLKYFDDTNKTRLLEFIQKNFNTGYTSKTLTRIYYDKGEK